MTTFENDRPSEHGVNLALVLLLHLGLGLIWLGVLAAVIGFFLSETWAIVWTLSAVATWLIYTVQIVRSRFNPARTWSLTVLWWLKSFIAPFALGFEALQFLTRTSPGPHEGPRLPSLRRLPRLPRPRRPPSLPLHELT